MRCIFLKKKGFKFMEKGEIKHTLLTVKNRTVLTINGVLNVISFDEDYLTLETNEGRIGVEGQGLKIESLTRDNGEIEIAGIIRGVFYTDKKMKEKPFLRLRK